MATRRKPPACQFHYHMTGENLPWWLLTTLLGILKWKVYRRNKGDCCCMLILMGWQSRKKFYFSNGRNSTLAGNWVGWVQNMEIPWGFYFHDLLHSFWPDELLCMADAWIGKENGLQSCSKEKVNWVHLQTCRSLCLFLSLSLFPALSLFLYENHGFIFFWGYLLTVLEVPPRCPVDWSNRTKKHSSISWAHLSLDPRGESKLPIIIQTSQRDEKRSIGNIVTQQCLRGDRKQLHWLSVMYRIVESLCGTPETDTLYISHSSVKKTITKKTNRSNGI